MKMRTIIETGRKTSPVVNTSLAALKTQIDVFGQILSDFSSVQSECGRAALLEQCAGGLARLAAALNDTTAAWRRFDSTLSDYKYVFGQRKKGIPPDLPGQQFIDFDQKKLKFPVPVRQLGRLTRGSCRRTSNQIRLQAETVETTPRCDGPRSFS